MALNATMKTVRKNLLAVTFAMLTVVTMSAQAIPGTKPSVSAMSPELLRVRAALEKYQDPVVAIHDGYLSTLASSI